MRPDDSVRVVDRVDRLGQDVEQRDAEDDAACERDQRRQLAVETERDEAAGQRGDDRQPGEWDRDPVHAQLRHVP